MDIKCISVRLVYAGAGNRFPTKIYYRTVFAHNAERPPLEEPWGVFEEGIDPAPCVDVVGAMVVGC